MADKPFNLQDQFLNSVRRSKTPATLFLVKGVKLQGVITWFDAFSLLLRRDGMAQLVYKHSISTIIPAHPLADLALPQLAGEASGARKPALQDLFLGAVTASAEDMTLFLVNGVALQGHVTAFDQFSILLERAGQVQLIYKHAVSTLQPAHPLWLGGDDAEQPSEDDA